jgi:hypothetical protein
MRRETRGTVQSIRSRRKKGGSYMKARRERGYVESAELTTP